MISTATGGRTYAVKVAGSASGNIPGAGLYFYDQTGTGIVMAFDTTKKVNIYNGLAVTGALSSTTGATFATSSGNVGIGATTVAGVDSRLRVVGGSDGNSGISMGCSATERPTLGFRVSDNSQRAKIELNDANGAGGDRLGLFAFASGILTEVMSLRGSGNVGIGTTSPDHPLNTSRPLATVWRPDIRVGGYLGTQKGFIGSNNSDSRIKLSGGAEQTDSDGVSNWATAYGTTGAFVDIGELGATRFFNNSGLTANATYAPTERMRIDSNGVLMVGTTNTDPTFNRVNGTNITSDGRIYARASGAWDLGANSSTPIHIAFYTDNGSARVTAGSISSSGSTTTYATSSDYRRKSNVADLSGSGAFIDALKPRTFDWDTGDKGVGFIAHEFAEVCPSAVTGEKDAVDSDGKPVYQAMQASSSEVIANLVAELQSLRARVAALELN
jgi:hypothetical protein